MSNPLVHVLFSIVLFSLGRLLFLLFDDWSAILIITVALVVAVTYVLYDNKRSKKGKVRLFK